MLGIVWITLWAVGIHQWIETGPSDQWAQRYSLGHPGGVWCLLSPADVFLNHGYQWNICTLPSLLLCPLILLLKGCWVFAAFLSMAFSFLANRKGKVTGFRVTQVSSCALPFAAAWPWTSGSSSLGFSTMGTQTPASWGCLEIKEVWARHWCS